jgi:hypothetical protein
MYPLDMSACTVGHVVRSAAVFARPMRREAGGRRGRRTKEKLLVEKKYTITTITGVVQSHIIMRMGKTLQHPAPSLAARSAARL